MCQSSASPRTVGDRCRHWRRALLHHFPSNLKLASFTAGVELQGVAQTLDGNRKGKGGSGPGLGTEVWVVDDDGPPDLRMIGGWQYCLPLCFFTLGSMDVLPTLTADRGSMACPKQARRHCLHYQVQLNALPAPTIARRAEQSQMNGESVR